jgi:hypothetical protein
MPTGVDGTCGGGSQSCFEWRIGQFGRSLRYSVTTLADFGAYGIAFVSMMENP